MVKEVMCPHCGYVSDYFPPDHKFCGNCGHKLPRDLKKMEFNCPSCGLKHKDKYMYGTAKHCTGCGSKL